MKHKVIQYLLLVSLFVLFVAVVQTFLNPSSERIINLAFAQATPAPYAAQTINPLTVEARGNWIAHGAVAGNTGNTYVVAYDWISADQCENKLITIENTGATNDATYKITKSAVNSGGTLFPVSIGGTPQTDIVLQQATGVALEINDPASLIVVSLKSSVTDAATSVKVQGACFKQ